ncbi:BZ3500_MvSof-1268-A1-R1_Chr5-3g08314 [Microbotryum saponariae]|uniref:BZ3500_MvSof-1268-A1-R1_Chr5-3g08314 protein n=1 Tax=Microbotryum saponariae TaxID=289078 RepID=A0A2X0KHG7_9BASI|nr:BZ3500_MvSof-1268-A1-R1_Chr5-3g08314 [Microbotryum saponariae]SDA08422.1 BZ3501_MvSof-1269-A2-R1_Chr5-3g08042 [Microbotryum saponariae]
MASLNWVMLSPSRSPIPLPSEKVLHTIGSVSISLFPCAPGSAPNAKPTPASSESKSDKGTLYATNKRVVYVSTVAREGKGTTVDSLSVPWQSFVDGRFVQPWFGANYYEALCLPDPRSTDSGISTPHLSRFYFNEAGGYQFYEICEEMKARIGNSSGSGRGTPVEALPLYEPPSTTTTGPGPGPGPSPLSQLQIDPTTTSTPTPTTSQIDLASPQEPSATDLAVAHVAQQAQLDEAQQAERDLDRATAAGGSNLSSGIGAVGVPQRDGGEDDGPPGYEA